MSIDFSQTLDLGFNYTTNSIYIQIKLWTTCDFVIFIDKILYTNINRHTYKIEIDTITKIVKIRHKLFNDHNVPDNIKGNYQGSEDFSYHFRIPYLAVLMVHTLITC